MKIQCDVCSAEEASVFCCADEAALCGACDRRVHSANKLASKHRRLSLLRPDPHAATLCDICQERRGMLFCQEDRAILCRDCDSSIHHQLQVLSAKHSRFLLTGVRLSSSPLPAAVAEAVGAKLEEEEILCTISNTNNSDSSSSSSRNRSRSSISEYLIKTLPGWHFEDFLFDDAAANPFAAVAAKNSFYHDQVS